MVTMTFISPTEAAPEAMEIRLYQRESLRLGSYRSAGIICWQKKILVPNNLRMYNWSNPTNTTTDRGGEDIAVVSQITFNLIGDGGPAKDIAFRRNARCSSKWIASSGRSAGEVTRANEARWRNSRSDRPRP
jgi:hypothetical protein